MRLADADNDGYPLWQELLYGTSDTVSDAVAQLLWEGGANTGGRNSAISSSGILPGDLVVQFWPDGGNGGFCADSVQVSQCHRVYCVHGLPARECGFCTGGSHEEWCSLHDEWKSLCACLSLGGGGMLAPGFDTVCRVGSEDDSCHNIHYDHCCDCIEHMGWSLPEEKTNIVRQVSTHLDVRLDGAVVTAGKKLIGPTSLTVEGDQLSVVFNDARIVASHELHPSDTVTSAWTVAAIDLYAEDYAAGRYPIRGGTNCVSSVMVLTDSALTEGSLRLDAGATGLLFSETEGAALPGAQALRTDTPPDSVTAMRDF